MQRFYDAIIVGGGSAGLSAALVLGRARRSVVVLDTSEPRNKPAHAAHGFFTRDGTPPAELLRIGREQLEPYGVEVRALQAEGAEAVPGGFRVSTADGQLLQSRRLLLASGVRDLLPEIPGLLERWGKSAIHCPYCHGWEVKDQPTAVYGRGESAFELAVMVRQWTPDLLVLSDGPDELDDRQRRQLAALGVRVDGRPVERLEGRGEGLERVVFKDGGVTLRTALYVRPAQAQKSELPARLGCDLAEGGAYVRTDEQGQTSVPGVYAAGDMTSRMQQIAAAASTGALAAAMLNRSLVQEDLGRLVSSA